MVRLSVLSSSSWQYWVLLLVLLGAAVLLISPVSASAATDWFDKGHSYYNAGRYDDALAAYNKALELDPNDEYAWTSKGNTLKFLGRYQEALDAFN
jgi:tetratricopeptide (TPR) repeat protein